MQNEVEETNDVDAQPMNLGPGAPTPGWEKMRLPGSPGCCPGYPATVEVVTLQPGTYVVCEPVDIILTGSAHVTLPYCPQEYENSNNDDFPAPQTLKGIFTIEQEKAWCYAQELSEKKGGVGFVYNSKGFFDALVNESY